MTAVRSLPVLYSVTGGLEVVRRAEASHCDQMGGNRGEGAVNALRQLFRN